jgi:hypothetical protein
MRRRLETGILSESGDENSDFQMVADPQVTFDKGFAQMRSLVSEIQAAAVDGAEGFAPAVVAEFQPVAPFASPRRSAIFWGGVVRVASVADGGEVVAAGVGCAHEWGGSGPGCAESYFTSAPTALRQLPT